MCEIFLITVHDPEPGFVWTNKVDKPFLNSAATEGNLEIYMRHGNISNKRPGHFLLSIGDIATFLKYHTHLPIFV